MRGIVKIGDKEYGVEVLEDEEVVKIEGDSIHNSIHISVNKMIPGVFYKVHFLGETFFIQKTKRGEVLYTYETVQK